MVGSKSHEFYMQLAIKEAIVAHEKCEVPIGAILVINEQVIARSHNQVELLNDSTAHAEIIAITGAFHHLGSKYLPDAILYVTVEPCLMCAGALYWSKIGTVVYGASDKKNGFSKFIGPGAPPFIHPLHPKTQIISGICEEECSKLIKSFFIDKRN